MAKILISSFILFIFMNLGFVCIQANEQEQVKKTLDIIMSCAKEHNFSLDEIKNLSYNSTNIEKYNCYLACVYKTSEMMDDTGMFSLEAFRKTGESMFQNNPTKMKTVTDYIEKCKSVNNAAVTDGAKGCERAVFMYKCSFDFANELGNK